MPTAASDDGVVLGLKFDISRVKQTLDQVKNMVQGMAEDARLNAIEISWETDAAYAEYFILRDGVPIARSAGSGITDRLCTGKHVYTVRGVTPEGYYGDSAPVHAFLAIENAVLGSVEDGAPWLKLRLRAGERPAHDGSYSAQVDYVHYYGRTKPEPYTCGMEDASHDFAFTLRDAAQMDALRGLLGSAVVYKDCWGDVVIGVLGNIQAAHGRARDIMVNKSHYGGRTRCKRN